MKALVQAGRGVPGSQYEGAGAMGGRVVRDWQSPEGRYVGPGAPAGAVTQDRLGFLQGRLAQAETVEALGRPSRAAFLRERVGTMRGGLAGEAATLQAEGEARRRMLAAGAGMAEAETKLAEALPGMATAQMQQQQQMQKMETITMAADALENMGYPEYAKVLRMKGAEAATGGQFVDPFADDWTMQVLRFLWQRNPANWLKWVFPEMYPEKQLVTPGGQ